MVKTFLVSFLLFFCVGMGLVSPSYGQNFPVKPIEIVCILPPGSSMDILARVTAEVAPKYLGQPIVVINKPGAGGALAAMDVVNSKPDGYKLVTLSNNSFMSTFQTQKIMFNPKQLVPMWSMIMFKEGMFIRADAPWKSLEELIEYARKNPDKVTWGHHGRGLKVQVAASMIFKRAGIQIIEVPHKGSAESMAALLGGHIDVLTTSYATVTPHVKSGKIRPIVTYEGQRYKDHPEVPTATELGYKDVEKLSTYVGLYGHRDVPEPVKKIMSEALRKTCEDAAFKAGIEKVGEEHRCETPEFAMEAIKRGEEVVVPILKELGIYVDQKF
jgi:tripartite-type tricarboxylate transporter receptor subunit TctC